MVILGELEITIVVPSNHTDEAVTVIAVGLNAPTVVTEGPMKKFPPGEKSKYGLRIPEPRVAVLTNGPGLTVTSAPFATVMLGVVKVVAPTVIAQFGIETPEIINGTPETRTPAVPVAAALIVKLVPVPPVGIVAVYVSVSTIALFPIVTLEPVVSAVDPPTRVHPVIATLLIVTVKPVKVPVPSVTELSVKDVPVPPVGIVIPEGIVIFGIDTV